MDRTAELEARRALDIKQQRLILERIARIDKELLELPVGRERLARCADNLSLRIMETEVELVSGTAEIAPTPNVAPIAELTLATGSPDLVAVNY